MSKETNRIKTILELTKQFPATTISGFNASVGLDSLDDCAVIPINDNYDLVIGSDFVRGAGFTLFEKGILSWTDIGYYLIAANASDIAAMGASPVGVVVVTRYKSDMKEKEYKDLMVGVTKACSNFSMPLLGGDTGGYESSVLSASAIGVCPKGKALLRRKGEPGDILYLTGDIGTAGAALAYFSRAVPNGKFIKKSLERKLVMSWKKVQPALLQAQLLTKENLSKCAIDTSDGLKAACRQISEPSNLDVVLFPEKIPISDSARAVAEALSVDPLTLAISDSVDFRLLFSVSKSLCEKLEMLFSKNNFNLFEIGELRETKNRPDVYFDFDGHLLKTNAVEWDQSEQLSIDTILKVNRDKKEI